MKIKTLIIQPVTPGLDLDPHSFRTEAHTALQEIADVQLESIKVDKFSDSAIVNLGTPKNPNMLSLWQLNLVAALCEADGIPYRDDQTLVTHIDEDTRHYSVTGVVQPNGSW